MSNSKEALAERVEDRRRIEMDPTSSLPEELWTRILEVGVHSSALNHRDLCSVAITCRRLSQISASAGLWAPLLARDFRPTSTETPPHSKSLYKDRFKKEKERRAVEQRFRLLTANSEVASISRRLKELERLILFENEKLKAAKGEISNLESARQASVALNVWQPAVVRGRQKQIVEQCTVPIDSRLSELNMEVRVCKHQLKIHTKSYNYEKQRLEAGKKKLESLVYHPMQRYQSDANDCNRKRKELDKSTDCQRNASCSKRLSLYVHSP